MALLGFGIGWRTADSDCIGCVGAAGAVADKLAVQMAMTTSRVADTVTCEMAAALVAAALAAALMEVVVVVAAPTAVGACSEGEAVATLNSR